MSTQDSQVQTSAGEAQALPDRTQSSATDTTAPEGEISKSAAKKAVKQAKMAAEKAEKAANKGIGKQEAKKPTSKASKKKIEGAALIGIDVSKEEDFPGWYQQVLTKGDMLDYYDVSGCFILKVSFSIEVTCFCISANHLQPTSYFVWETIQVWFNERIKKMGVKNCSFPLFVSEDVLQREKDHIEGFAAEVAWVTHA
jgi:prolyl-tRNA synthetase